jgi:alkylation response protein AidB-like acyl-CoA dehydrogenase
MMQAVGTGAQKAKYMRPYIEGTMTSAIAISEPPSEVHRQTIARRVLGRSR